ENFSGHQHHGADLQAGQFTQPAKDSVDPVAGQAWNALAIEKASEDAAVALFLLDEQLQRGNEPRVGGEDGMRGGPSPKAPAARPFAELELLNGLGDEPPFGGRQRTRVVPGKGARGIAVVHEMPVPSLVERLGGGRRERHGGHEPSIKYFT